MKIDFDKDKGQWIELPKGSPDGIYIDGYLKKRLDFIRKIIKKNWDCVILIDGEERSGKSILGMTIGYYLSDTNLNENNFASGIQDCAKKIKELPDKSILIVDEGSLVFSSKDAMSKAQKQLIKILDVVGQKNMIFIICLPSFFDLNKQIAIRRSKVLLHVYKNAKDWERGKFAFWNSQKKSKLYLLGKKNYGEYKYPPPDFYGRFLKFEPDFYQEYLKIKKKSMMEALDVGAKEFDRKEFLKQICINFKQTCPEVTQKTIAKVLGVTDRTIKTYMKEYREGKGETGNKYKQNLVKNHQPIVVPFESKETIIESPSLTETTPVP
jgi:hypothetical protein